MANDPPDAVPVITLCGGTKLARALQQGVAFTIGHAKSAALRIPHPAVSPIHCTLSWQGDQVTLQDEGSELGTQINGQPVAGQALLAEGDQITVGLFHFSFNWSVAGPNGESSSNGAGSSSPDTAPVPAGGGTARVRGATEIQFRGTNASEIPLFAGLTFGNGDKVDVYLRDPLLSGIQATIEAAPDGFIVIDSARAGSLVNGKYFERHPLVIGDLLQFGELHFFVFDGFALRPVQDGLGSGLQGSGIDVTGGGERGLILQSASFDARPGQFVGIIGPSGAGKTTLLKALLGLKPMSAGTLLLDGQDIHQIVSPSRFFGYVPQQEIVHLELTARQALRYSALLRLPARTPLWELDKLIQALTHRLGLQQHLDTRAGRLSGGQLKRLSVCVELLSRPPLLFLDEPTSGLDPESETELMQQLQELSYTGCTVVCTTHLMENVYLMSSLEVVMAGHDSQGRATPGRTVFRGKPRLAKELFNVRSLSKLYHRLKEGTPEGWQKLYQEKTGQSLIAPPAISPGPARTVVPQRSERRRWAVPILLNRQWQILRSDWKNLMLLVGQPVLIAGLIALVATGDNPTDKKLFLAAIAILWLGCGNAAPELVRERTIFRREQFVGLRASSYLISKFLGLGCLTGLQAVLIFGILKLSGAGLDGSALWQFTGMMASAAAATGLGLAISAWARTSLQAVLLVPVIIIPQILFAGFVFPIKDWEKHLIPRVVSRFFPSFAAQRVMDVSLLWNIPIAPPEDYKGKTALDYKTALDNLTTALRPLPLLLRPDQAMTVTIDEGKLYAPSPDGAEPFGLRQFEWNPARPNIIYAAGKRGDDRPRIFRYALPACTGLASLLLWTLAGCGTALMLLRRKDDE